MRGLLSSVARQPLRVVGLQSSLAHRTRHAAGPGRPVSLLDFGADTVKAAVVDRAGSDVRLLGYGFASAREADLSGGRTAVSALAAAADEALVAAEDRAALTVGCRVVPDDVLCCVPARFINGRLFTVRLARGHTSRPISEREVKAAWARLERLVRERLAEPEKGGLARKPLGLTRSSAAVDGHPVTDPVGLNGRTIAVSAFGVAVQAAVLRAIEAVAKRLEVTLLDVVAGPQALAALVPQRDALVVDVGHQGTSLSLVRGARLVATHWWPQGGELFTRSLADAFGCTMERAEALKRAHAGGILSAGDEVLVRQALSGPVGMWYDSLVGGLLWLTDRGSASLLLSSPAEPDAAIGEPGLDALPGRIYLTGGGSLLPDLVGAVRAVETAAVVHFGRAVEVESLGRVLGMRLPNQAQVLNAPTDSMTDLLAPVVSLAPGGLW
jgi:cell division ATPase FtsA